MGSTDGRQRVGRTVHQIGDREADSFYRDRWSHDKFVRSTDAVNCTGSRS